MNEQKKNYTLIKKANRFLILVIVVVGIMVGLTATENWVSPRLKYTIPLNDGWIMTKGAYNPDMDSEGASDTDAAGASDTDTAGATDTDTAGATHEDSENKTDTNNSNGTLVSGIINIGKTDPVTIHRTLPDHIRNDEIVRCRCL